MFFKKVFFKKKTFLHLSHNRSHTIIKYFKKPYKEASVRPSRFMGFFFIFLK